MIKDTCNLLSKYRPPFLAAPTLQILINEFVANDWHYKINYKRTNLVLANKATVSVDWVTPKTTQGKRKVCCVFPGMGGGSDRGYIKSVVQGMLDAGFEVAVLHIIGSGNTVYSSPHFADLSSNCELNACLDFVMKTCEDADIVAVGLSMGANQMMKLAGEKDCFFKAMVSINNPFDITANNNLMRGTVFEHYLVKHILNDMLLPNHRASKQQEK